MTVSELKAEVTYSELTKIVDENGEPFETVDQCDLYLRAASMLRRRIPEEADHSGERIRTRDLLEGMKSARKARAILLAMQHKPISIIPPDEIR